MSYLIDTNLLVYAAVPSAEQHVRARSWLKHQFDDDESFVALAWSALYGFARIVSNRRIVGEQALSSAWAWERALGYLDQPAARIVEPGPSHARIASALFKTPGLSTNNVSDVYLGALALEHGLTLASHDHGFARFSNLSWEDPLTPKG